MALKNIIINHKEISPEVINLEYNDGNGNCLFYSFSQMVNTFDIFEILGFKFINYYGIFNDDNISVLLLINMNNIHYLFG